MNEYILCSKCQRSLHYDVICNNGLCPTCNKKEKDNNLISRLSDSTNVIIPNWYNYEQLQDLLKVPLTINEYIKFRRWLNKSELESEINELIKEFYLVYKKEKDNNEHNRSFR